DRNNILTVEDLLTVPVRRLLRLRGVGNKTRREIGAVVGILREQLGNPVVDRAATDEEPQISEALIEAVIPSVDHLLKRILRSNPSENDNSRHALQALLGLDPAAGNAWPSQREI